MYALPLSACRVCLASDREMYRLANTALEETYERVTSGTLVVEGRPCCVCGVCLSALRRCRRFIDTAREANDALDRWIRNQPNTDTLKFTEHPLFSFTRSPVKFVEITSQGIWELGVKQESDTTENKYNKIVNLKNEGTTSDDEGNILTGEIKFEVTSDDGNDDTHVSDDESDEAQMSDNIDSHSSPVLYNFECVNIQEEMIDVEVDTKTVGDVKINISDSLDNVGGETAPSTSNVGRNNPTSSQEDIPLQNSRKRLKLNKDTKSGPVLKKRRPITSEHRSGNTDPAAVLHTEENTFSCRQCSYKNANKNLMMTHLKIHSKEKQLFGEKYDYKCLKKGSMTHTSEKPFVCDMCDYKCTRQSVLNVHLLTHTGEKPFACDKCDYKCRRYFNLQRHKMRHTGEKRFACDKCDYKCSQKDALKHHLLTHTGEKPFACDKCDYKCYQKSSLNRHLQIHIGNKPFVCNKCDYKCSKKSQFIQHSITHSTEKPFVCDMCDYKCLCKLSLKRHLMGHSGKKQFACDKCDYKCIDKRSLYKHIQKVHATST